MRKRAAGMALLAGAALLSGCGKPDPEAEYRAGVELLGKGHAAAGKARIEAAMALATNAPFAAEAYNWLGLASRELGKVPEAIGHFERATGLAPTSYAPTYNLGCLVLESGDVKRGIGLLRKAADLDAKDTKALMQIGEWTTRNGKWDQARRMYAEILKREPGSAAALAGQGRVALLEGKTDEARGRFEEALGRDGKCLPALYNLGVLHSQAAGGGELAGDYFRRYLELAPKGERAVAAQKRLADGAAAGAGAGGKTAQDHLKVGRNWLAQGRPADARDAFMKAQALAPDDAAVLAELARASTLLEDYDAALLALRKILQMDPGNADALWALSELLGDKMGMAAKGAASFRVFAKKHPGDSRAGKAAERAAALERAAAAPKA